MKEIRYESTWILYFLFFQSLLYNIASFSSARILTSLVTIVFIQEEDAFTIHIVKLVLETLLIISNEKLFGFVDLLMIQVMHWNLDQNQHNFFHHLFLQRLFKQNKLNPRLSDDRKNYSLLYETLGAWRVVIIWCTNTGNQNSQNAILKTFKFCKVMVI